MAKEKFHTSHHCERRYHKNGIKKPTKTKYESLEGVCERDKHCSAIPSS